MADVEKDRVVLSTGVYDGQQADVIIETWVEEVENDGETVEEPRVAIEVSYDGISPDIAFFPYSDAAWAYNDLTVTRYNQGIISSRFDQIDTSFSQEVFDAAIESVSAEAGSLIADHFGL